MGEMRKIWTGLCIVNILSSNHFPDNKRLQSKKVELHCREATNFIDRRLNDIQVLFPVCLLHSSYLLSNSIFPSTFSYSHILRDVILSNMYLAVYNSNFVILPSA